MALGTTAALFLGLSAAGAGVAASRGMMGGARQSAQQPMPLPQAPRPEASQAAGEEAVRKKRASMTKTIYTSPLGVAGEADVARKTLLGQ